MSTLTIDVSNLTSALDDFASTWKTGTPAPSRFSFDSMQTFLTTMTPRRWDILRTLMGKGKTGVRELARQLGRDVKSVHVDAQALVSCGLVEKDMDGKLHFPYDAIHVDVVVKAA